MLRIIMLVIRGIFSLPGWYSQLKKMKDDPNVSMDERYRLARRICQWIVKHGSIQPVVTGVENLPEKDGYLLAPNHQGLFDPVIICHTHPHFTTAVVKIELTRTFFVKDLVQLLKARSMDRENLRQSMRVIHEVTKDLKQGINYIIFPEGTRSKKGNKLGEFKAGTFKSATNAKATIVPVALINCYQVFDRNSLRKVYPEVHYLKPIPYEEYQDLSSNEIASLVQSRVEAKIAERLAQ